MMMMPKFDRLPALGPVTMDAMMKGVSAVAKTSQTAGLEMADFAKQSLSHTTATMKSLAETRSPRTAMEIQGEFLKSAYERMAAQAKVMTGLYSDLAKELAEQAKSAQAKSAQATSAQDNTAAAKSPMGGLPTLKLPAPT